MCDSADIPVISRHRKDHLRTFGYRKFTVNFSMDIRDWLRKWKDIVLGSHSKQVYCYGMIPQRFLRGLDQQHYNKEHE